MKTTIEIPDELFRQAEAAAFREGILVQDLMADGLRQIIASKPPLAAPRRHVDFPLIRINKGEHMITPGEVEAAERQMFDEEALRNAKLVRR